VTITTTILIVTITTNILIVTVTTTILVVTVAILLIQFICVQSIMDATVSHRESFIAVVEAQDNLTYIENGRHS